MGEKAVAESEERGLRRRHEGGPARLAFAGSRVAPTFQRAIGHWCSRRAETGGMEELPGGGEVREVLAFEDLAEVHLDEGRPREAGVVAHQPKLVSVGAKAPESLIGLIEPILQGGGSGSPAAALLFHEMRRGRRLRGPGRQMEER